MTTTTDDNFAKDDSEEEQIPIDEPIISYGADYTLDSISQYINNETILVQPAFQRKFVWDIKKASKLIESFLLGYPVPNILLGRPQNDDKMEVIDGQQRLTTISDFINGTFNKDTVFKLTGDVLPKYAGKMFKDLDEPTQRRFKNAILKAIVLVYRENDPDLKYSVFQRINTGSVILNQQEIRNCIFGGSLNDLLHSLNEEDIWRRFFSAKPDKRMRDEESILRFFASFYNWENYEKPMTSFLNKFMSKHKDIGEIKQQEWRELFIQALTIIEDNFKLGNPFALSGDSKQFNRAIFEAIIVAIARLQAEGKNDFSDFTKKHKQLVKTGLFIESVSTGTSSEKKYTARITLAYDTLK